jgi:dsDNA-specific endonuclease/ATPase MutS2
LEKKNQTFTRTSVTLTKGTTIITGANMGGKSLSMKTMALNMMLCNMGFYVFAEYAEIPIFDHIAFISGDLQDVDQGLSTFGADMFHLNKLVNKLKNEFSFVALDEFAKGTNPEEGAIIVREIASYLSECGSVCVMSTHYDGVVTPDFKHYQVVGIDLEKMKKIESKENVFGKQVSQYMDYRLIEVNECALAPRDALHICQLIGLDEDLLNRIKNGYNV